MSGFGQASLWIGGAATAGCFFSKGWKDVVLVAMMYTVALAFLAAEVFS